MKKLLISLAIIILSFGLVLPVNAADVTLAWDENSPPVAGYGVYWSTVNEMPFPNTADAGNVTQFQITGLEENTTYYFAVDAYDSTGNRSDYSDILAYTILPDRIVIRVLDRPGNITVIWKGME